MVDTQVEALLREGERLLDQNLLQEAHSHYAKLCDIAPGNAEAWFMLGAINLEFSASAQARACFRKAIENDPAHAEAYLNLAASQLSDGDTVSALKNAERAVQLDSDFAEAWLILGKTQGMGKDLTAAENSTRRAIQLWPESAEAHFNLAVILRAQGKAEAALQAYTDALVRQPDQAEGWRQRAGLEEQLGRWVDAEASSRKALALNPNDTESCLIIARSLLLQDRAAEALSEFEHALKQNPDNSQALIGLGSALEALEQLEKAADALQRALVLDPDSAKTWFMLAMIEYQQGDLMGALEYSEKAVAVQPDFAPACVLQGDLLRTMGRLDEALTAYERVANKGGTDANMNAVAGKVMVHDKQGRHEDAYGALRPHLDSGATNHRLAVAYASLCSHAGSCDEATQLLEELLSNPRPGRDPRQAMRDRQELHHHLGKLYDKAHDYDGAFDHFKQANDYKKRNSPFKPDQHVRLVDQIIADYTLDSVRAAPTSGCDSQRPLFILGMPRSGTTLVEQILCSHPDVFGGGEQQELPRIAADLDERPNSSLVRPPRISDLTVNRLRGAADRYLGVIAQVCKDARYVTDKMPYNFFHLGLIRLMFPECKVVHCVRDPLDTCLSTYFQNFSGYQGFATDLQYIAVYYSAYRRLLEHWQRTLDLPIHTIRYETLVEDQESETQRLLEFCDLKWDAGCLEFYKNPRVALTASYNQIRRPMYRTSKQRWKNYKKYLAELMVLHAESQKT